MNLTQKEAEALGIIDTAAGPGRKRKKTDKGKDPFPALCVAHGLPEPVPEYPFAESIGRKWRVDYLFEGWLALEIEGGVFAQGRHVRGTGFLADIEKYNELAIMGYVLIRCTPKDIETGAVFGLIQRALGSREEQP